MAAPDLPISVSASGDTALIAAVANRRIRVLAYAFVCNAANSVKFKTGATDLTGAMPCAANGGVSAAHNPAGWFTCNVNEALNLNLSAASLVAGHLSYEMVL